MMKPSENDFRSRMKVWMTELVLQLIAKWVDNPPGLNPWHRFGTIDAGYVSGRPKVLFDGEDTATDRQYPYVSSYTPVAGDRVYLARAGKSWIIIGKVL